MKKKFPLSPSRRDFVSNSLKTAAMLPLASVPLTAGFCQPERSEGKEPSTPLNILILGGTSFLGPHQIAYALKRGHRISTFTRGKTRPRIHTKLFDQVEQLIGDREDNLEALKGRKWDAVIDNSGRQVHWTKTTAELLKDHVGIYAYTSSVSVFYPYFKANVKEGDPLILSVPEKLENENDRPTFEYGVMKANSELEAIKAFGKDRSIIVRPTFMMGPADRTDRFIYWPTKLAVDGEVIIPGKSDDPVQYIDVRDIAEWMIRLIENKNGGTYNGVGPKGKMTIPAFVYGAAAAFSASHEFIHIDDEQFLDDNNVTFVTPWIRNLNKYHGMPRVNNDKAIANDLTFKAAGRNRARYPRLVVF